tara:strand:- start:914 stop:1378 length:465 start_codon:yes stop_codon:yes gene_type:complete
MKKQFYTLQDGIKNALKDLSEEEILDATKTYAGVAKNKAYFYKCAEGKAHDIHHKYALALDIACIRKEKTPSMFKAHEAMIEKYFNENPNTTRKEMTLYLGQLMEDVGRLTSTVVTGLEDGTLTQAEQKDIKVAIKKAEESIVQLKKRISEEVD